MTPDGPRGLARGLTNYGDPDFALYLRRSFATSMGYSKAMLAFCQERRIPFIYASSASVYGMGPKFAEDVGAEKPINLYAYSKHLFDQYVKRVGKPTAQVAGLRYFNVYGPREQHKGGMASTAFHFNNQVEADGECRLFEGSDGYQDGEQRRDFVFVDDAADAFLRAGASDVCNGEVFNVGGDEAISHRDLTALLVQVAGSGQVRYVDWPADKKVIDIGSFYADSTKFKTTTGWAPAVPLADGLRRTVAYYREHLDRYVGGEQEPSRT